MDRRFPIGPFVPPSGYEPDGLMAQVGAWIDRIESFPARLREAVRELPAARLDEPYRDLGWTRRQVIHHVADSHMNSFVRFKWALTEPNPTIKAYDEAAWAELADYRDAPIETSLVMIDALHARWTVLLRSLGASDLKRTFVHPESGDTIDLATNVGIYAWHGDHHIGHLQLP